MQIIHFCPACWKEMGEEAVCPMCGENLQRLAEASYEEKLIGALRHPEPTVPVRAAEILGELRSRAAVPALIEAARNTQDAYIQEAIAQALGTIGDERASSCLKRLRREGTLRVRTVAERALGLLEPRTS